jgi:hypothetical protein
MAPGDYVLQVVVTDHLANRKHQTATQTIDFEIVREAAERSSYPLAEHGVR